MAAVTALELQVAFTISAASSERALELVRGAVENFAWPPVIGVVSPVQLKPGKKPKPPVTPDLAALLDRLADPASSGLANPGNFTLQLGARSSLSLVCDGNIARGNVVLALADHLYEDPADNLDRLMWFVRWLASQAVLVEAVFRRSGDTPGGCVPVVPLALRRVPLVVTTDDQLADLYDRPDEFLSAGWQVERYGRQLLLTRLHEALTRAEVLAASRDHQWQMARAAKPAVVRWETPVIEPEEQPIFEEGDAKLELVGVDASGRAEFSCTLAEGEHLAGFDVYYLQEIVLTKQLRDGTPATAVHVVFEDRSMAESEKRPLLDLGVRVFYMDPATDEDVELVI
jgi:hypothetical protein